MKLCRNIQSCVTAFEGLNNIKMAAVAMVSKEKIMLNSLQKEDPFETSHKNRPLLKVVLFVFKIYKMDANIKIKKIIKNSKIKRFQWKYLQGVRHAAPYCDHLGWLWWPF